MKYLVTYRCERDHNPQKVIYGYSITDDPIEWLAYVQEFQDEKYILINAQPMTDEQSEKYDGAFVGM